MVLLQGSAIRGIITAAIFLISLFFDCSFIAVNHLLLFPFIFKHVATLLKYLNIKNIQQGVSGTVVLF